MTDDPSPALRRLRATVAGLGTVGLVTLALLPARDEVSVATPALVLLVPGVAAGVLGGRVPAFVTAIGATLALNLVFIEPYGTLDVHLVDDVVALAAFVTVAFVVSALLALALERSRVAQQHAAELVDLERARDAQRALLRSVSHDLRTPLAAIQGITTDLRATDANYDDATQRELLEVVTDEADRLDRLVANLLSLSRVEAGALTPELQAVDLEELLTDRVQRLPRVLHDVHVATHLPEVLPLVDADYTLTEQVITNLLENAARHAPPQSTISIDVRETADEVEIAISDHGPGVPPDDRASIFEPFRSGGTNRSTGIGLAICKAIVEAHGGHITVGDATSGTGARFAFTLPVHWVQPEPIDAGGRPLRNR